TSAFRPIIAVPRFRRSEEPTGAGFDEVVVLTTGFTGSASTMTTATGVAIDIDGGGAADAGALVVRARGADAIAAPTAPKPSTTPMTARLTDRDFAASAGGMADSLTFGTVIDLEVSAP